MNSDIREKYIYQCDTFKLDTLVLIKELSIKMRISSELLFAIASIEKFNRGGIVNTFVENLLCISFPNFVIKSDLSIGICQIKISTAKKHLKGEACLITPKMLISSKTNLLVCAKILSSYNTSDFDKIVYKYICKENGAKTKEYYIYLELLKWSVQNQLFSKTYTKKKLLRLINSQNNNSVLASEFK